MFTQQFTYFSIMDIGINQILSWEQSLPSTSRQKIQLNYCYLFFLFHFNYTFGNSQHICCYWSQHHLTTTTATTRAGWQVHLDSGPMPQGEKNVVLMMPHTILYILLTSAWTSYSKLKNSTSFNPKNSNSAKLKLEKNWKSGITRAKTR